MHTLNIHFFLYRFNFAFTPKSAASRAALCNNTKFDVMLRNTSGVFYDVTSQITLVGASNGYCSFQLRIKDQGPGDRSATAGVIKADLYLLRSVIFVDPAKASSGDLSIQHARLGTTAAAAAARIAYYDPTNANLMVMSCTDSQCSGNSVKVLSSQGDVGQFASLALTFVATTAGTSSPVISFYNATSKDLLAVTCADSACSTVTARSLAQVGDVGSYSQIALSSANQVAMAYYDATLRSVQLMQFTSPIFASQVFKYSLGAATDFGDSALIFRADKPLLVYGDGSQVLLVVCQAQPCSALNSQTVVIDTGVTATGFAMQLTSTGLPIISYVDLGSDQIVLVVCTNLDCSLRTVRVVESVGEVGDDTSLLLTSGDIPLVAYIDNLNGLLKLAVCSSSRCPTATVSVVDRRGSGGAGVGLKLSMSLDSLTKLPVIAYQTASRSGKLRLAVCQSLQCGAVPPSSVSLAIKRSSWSLNGGAAAGNDLAMEINSAGYAVIAFFDASRGFLSLATCSTGNDCTPQRVVDTSPGTVQDI